MPIHEFYCPDNNTVYQFLARTLAQGRTVPRCPDNPAFRMERMISAFAVGSGSSGKGDSAGDGGAGDGLAGGGADAAEDARMASAMDAMEREFAHVDENDPRAMGRMMRRMAEVTGEKIDGEMEEVVRRLEEGADPESLDESLGAGEPEPGPAPDGGAFARLRARRRIRRKAPVRDPHLYDYGDT